jgi:hypothetical protein
VIDGLSGLLAPKLGWEARKTGEEVERVFRLRSDVDGDCAASYGRILLNLAKREYGKSLLGSILAASVANVSSGQKECFRKIVFKQTSGDSRVDYPKGTVGTLNGGVLEINIKYYPPPLPPPPSSSSHPSSSPLLAVPPPGFPLPSLLSAAPFPPGVTKGHLPEEWVFLEVMHVGSPPKVLVKLGGRLVTADEIAAHELLHALCVFRDGVRAVPIAAAADDNLINRVLYWSNQLATNMRVFDGLPASAGLKQEFKKQWDQGRSDEISVIAPLLTADDGRQLGDGFFADELLTAGEAGLALPLPFDLFTCKEVTLENLGKCSLRFGHGTAAKVRFMLERKILVGYTDDEARAQREDEFLRATAVPFYAKLLKKSVDEVVDSLPRVRPFAPMTSVPSVP